MYALCPEFSSAFSEIGSDTIKWTFIAVLAYLIGLINHQLTSLVWRPFRNNLVMINKSHINKENKENKKKSDSKSGIQKNSFIIPVFIYLIMIMIIFVWGILVYKSCALYIALLILFVIDFYLNTLVFKKNIGDDSMDNYYKAYYDVAKKGYNNDITIMEGQVAFLQSMLLPVIAMSASLICCGKMQPSCLWVSFVLILSMIATIYMRQMKIYRRVWEDDKYL